MMERYTVGNLVFAYNYPFVGRSVIYTSANEGDINERTVPKIISGAMLRHEKNRAEESYLYNYWKGYQPILNRQKNARPEINNKLVVNLAYQIVRNANGYFLGEPIKYTSKDAECRDDVEKLNMYMDELDKAAEDMDIGEYASVCGTAYRLVSYNEESDVSADVPPFKVLTLSPFSTFVVYSTAAGNPPMLGVTYYDILNDYGGIEGRVYTAYDKHYQYQYTVTGAGTSVTAEDLDEGFPKAHLLGDIPIVEYPNNKSRMGDFESVITVLNAINESESDRVNSVQQLVQSILVFKNCHLRTAEESKDGVPDLEKLKNGGALEMESTTTSPADVQYVSCGIDQGQAETLTKTLVDYVYAITGIPDRNNKSGGTGDTGDAVYLRDGFQNLEIVARIKQRQFKKSEKRMLRMVCVLMNVYEGTMLHLPHIEVNFVRNRTNNLLSKAQAMQILHNMQVFDPVDVITLGNITEMPGEMAERGERYWKNRREELARETGTNAEAPGSTVQRVEQPETANLREETG